MKCLTFIFIFVTLIANATGNEAHPFKIVANPNTQELLYYKLDSNKKIFLHL